MRTIKFRGMSVSGEWRYGNVSILPDRVHDVEAGTYISNKAGCPFAYQVRPETVGEFTGLTDKNGKEIYEGDVVRQFSFTGKVEYRLGMFGYIGIGEADFIPYGHNWNFDWVNGKSDKIEVIGNIHESEGKVK